MKYKVGDEVLVKAKIVDVDNNGYYARARNGNFTFWVEDESIVENPDMTAEEAWEIARKIIYDVSDGGMSIGDLRNVFGISNFQSALRNNTPQQAKAKIEAWEAEKEIKVGDEVALKESPENDDYKFFVTYINGKNNRISGWSGFSGYVFCEREMERYQKDRPPHRH